MKLIYVASPYRGDIEKNTAYAKDCCNFVIAQGCNFFCPHLILPKFLDDSIPQQRELALQMGKDTLLRCDELWCFGSYISEGMRSEIDFAEEHGINVKHISDIYHAHKYEPCLCQT